MIKHCQQCGRLFIPSRSHRDDQKFCSQTCYEKFKREHTTKQPAPMKQKQCEMCGKTFETRHSLQAKYCPDCRHAASLERDRKRNQRVREMRQEAKKCKD